MADADEGRCMTLAHSTVCSLTVFNGLIVNNMDIMLYYGLYLLKIILGQNLCGDVEKDVVYSYFSDKKKKVIRYCNINFNHRRANFSLCSRVVHLAARSFLDLESPDVLLPVQ